MLAEKIQDWKIAWFCGSLAWLSPFVISLGQPLHQDLAWQSLQNIKKTAVTYLQTIAVKRVMVFFNISEER